MTLVLRPFAREDYAACLVAHEELATEGFDFPWGYEPSMSWDEYLTMVADYAAGRNIPDDRVAAALLLADVAGEVVGRISVRFALNDFLFARGGHIGYAVRPAFRRRGYATEILAQGLAIANAHGVDPVLVTCNDTNVASAGVIERCGGVFDSMFVDENVDGSRIRRYWISHSL
jgi:predicted acetyltransferase